MYWLVLAAGGAELGYTPRSYKSYKGHPSFKKIMGTSKLGGCPVSAFTGTQAIPAAAKPEPYHHRLGDLPG